MGERIEFRSFGRGGRGHQRIVDRRRDAVRRFVLVGDLRQSLPRLLSLALPVPHTGIKSARCQKLGMGAALGDAALIEYDDFVGADLSLIHISEPTRRTPISYAV